MVDSLGGFSSDLMKNKFDMVFNYLKEIATFKKREHITYNDRGGVEETTSSEQVRIVPSTTLVKNISLEREGSFNISEMSFFVHRDDITQEQDGVIEFRGKDYNIDSVDEFVWQGDLIAVVLNTTILTE